ncbi:MAG: hypothetical protein JWR84_1702 [Caulobacter sp.]|nr:hypothetical protein [Caulobacter sp.]
MAADLSESEWRAVLDELRERVAALGFGDWDHHAALYVEEMPPSKAAIAYLREFIGKQNRATTRSLAELKERLSERLQGPEGERITSVNLIDNRFEREREIELFGDVIPTDAFVTELSSILNFLEAGDEGPL